MHEESKYNPVRVAVGYVMRPLRKEDLEWARRLHNDLSVLSMITDPTVVTASMQKLWFQTLKKSSKSKRLLVLFNGKKIGIVRLDDIDLNNRSICVGLDIEKKYRGMGHAKHVYAHLLNYCFHTLGMNRCWLFVAEYNTIARNLYKKLGFQEEGKARQGLYRDGTYHDYILMSLLAHEEETYESLYKHAENATISLA